MMVGSESSNGSIGRVGRFDVRRKSALAQPGRGAKYYGWGKKLIVYY